MSISQNDIRKIRITAERDMFSAMGQDIRIENITKVGGTPNVAYDVIEGGVDTLNILDTKAIITHIDDRRLLEFGMTLTDADFFFIDVETEINLKNKPNFVIVQKIDDPEYWDGNGIGAASVWTPDVVQAWTIDQWKGFWLWFSDKRFEIVSNTATALTVTLGNYTLPTISTYGEIVSIKKYNPINDAPPLGSGMRYPFGSGILFQTIIATTVGTVGDSI